MFLLRWRWSKQDAGTHMDWLKNKLVQRSNTKDKTSITKWRRGALSFHWVEVVREGHHYPLVLHLRLNWHHQPLPVEGDVVFDVSAWFHQTPERQTRSSHPLALPAQHATSRMTWSSASVSVWGLQKKQKVQKKLFPTICHVTVTMMSFRIQFEMLRWDNAMVTGICICTCVCLHYLRLRITDYVC